MKAAAIKAFRVQVGFLKSRYRVRFVRGNRSFVSEQKFHYLRNSLFLSPVLNSLISMETKNNWIILNLVLPFLPLLLRAIVKVLMKEVDWELISASELWFVMALTTLIISLDLKLRTVPLDNNDKDRERSDRASLFLLLFMVFVFLCPLSEFFHILVDKQKREDYYDSNVIITILSYLSAFWTISFSLQTQTQFNLTAKFI